MAQDRLTELLAAAPLTNDQRAAAWDAFQAARTADELTEALRSLPIPQALKADLWDLKDTQGAAPRISGSTNARVEQPARVGGRANVKSEGAVLDAVRGANDIIPSIARGAGKGLVSTVTGLADTASALPLAGGAIGTMNQALWGVTPDQTAQQRATVRAGMAPSNTAELVGQVGEQIAEAVIPGRKITQAGQAIATRLPRMLDVPVRAAVEAGGGAAIAAAQGQDPMVGGAIGGAIPVVGGALRGVQSMVAPPVNSALRSAVDFARARGIPIDAASATGSEMARRIQNALGRGSLGGAWVASRQENARQAALARVSGELADEAFPIPSTPSVVGAKIQNAADIYLDSAYTQAADRVRPGPVTPEAAGAAVDTVLGTRQAAFKDTADEMYARGREIEAANVQEVQDAAATRTDLFQWDGTGGDLFAKAWEDAQRQGFPGGAQEFRALLNDRAASAKALVDQANDDNWGLQVLNFIAKNGGIGKVEADVSGEVARLWEMSTAARAMGRTVGKNGKVLKQQFKDSGAIGGVQGVVRRGGKTIDQMMEALRADPEIGHNFVDLPDHQLFGLIEEAAEVASKGAITPGEALAQAGVRPGTAWWEGGADDAMNALGGAASKAKPVGLPVSMKEVKDAIRPVVEQYEQSLTITQRQSDPGLRALQQILEGDDVVAASVADMNLSTLKRMAGRVPGLRNRSEGLAALAVQNLEASLQKTLAEVPEAADVLAKGREAVKGQYRVAELRESLESEPVRRFNQLVEAGDRGIERLRAVAAEAGPDEMRRVGRAWLDEHIAKNADYGKWDSLGDETKRIVFGDQRRVQAIDAYVERARRLSLITKGRMGQISPEALFTTLTAARDANIGILREIPRGQLPEVGRALLDQMFTSATAQSGFRREAGLYAQWQKLGPQTKAMLFPNPQVRQNLDNFFLYAQKSAEDLNRSGSGYMGLIGAQVLALPVAGVQGLALMLPPYVLSEMLYSPKAMSVLRTMTQRQPKSGARSAAAAQQLARMFGGTVSPATPAEVPTPEERP